EESTALKRALAEHLRVALGEGVAAPPIDDEQVDQARFVLAKTPLERRIYRRVKRDYGEKNPGEFTVQEVLGRKAEALFYRRSGAPLSEGVPNFFTYNAFHTYFAI